MTDPRPLPPLVGDQALASDPDLHVWLSASAGTGKTQVLSARVYRLLLRGVDPAAILALTFTKAGAAEMADRINTRLAHWVRMDEAALKKDLFALGEDHRDPAVIARARTLFARVLDAPGGGIRIQTIHGFCQTMLAAFPVEAGLTPGFRPIEGQAEGAMLREALAEMLLGEAAIGRARLIEAIGALSIRLGEGGAEAFLTACARSPRAMAALPSGLQPFLRRALDLPQGDVEQVIAAACADDRFDTASLRRIADANRAWGGKTGAAHCELCKRFLAQDPAGRAALLGELRAIAHTKDGEPRKISAKLIDADPGYAELVADLGEECVRLSGLAARAAYADTLAAALDAGRAYADAYVRAKRRAGVVDFGDMIAHTLDLLARPGIGEWVRFKLDQTTEHVLIDEAQDTNWDQWEIVRALADEYFAGAGSREEGVRTLFTVGDYKQAIFGFQGTSPVFYEKARRHFDRLGEHAAPDGGLALETLSLTHSFRSTTPILSFVDAAVGALPIPGMGLFAPVEAHASRVEGQGRVELWTPTEAAAAEAGDEEGWVAEPVRAHATRIAREIAALLASGATKRDGTPLSPGDVMVLVQRRGELAGLLVARLYAEGVPVAGVDRLRLDAPLAVQDLLAAVRFALQPEDDLSLAALLVSPLIGWSQDELMRRARRGPVSLWRHLRDTLADELLAPPRAILGTADFTTPYRFFEGLLSGPLDARRRLVERLGEEARDPIDELLSAALAFERQATPSLQRFLDWFDRDEIEVKRDAGEGGDAVRVMTAHGSKGLQAPVVILADATADPARRPDGLLQWAPEDHAGPGFPILRPRGDELAEPLASLVAEAEARELEEHWRLFYVAATRAEERLIIGGSLSAQAKGAVPPLSWHAIAGAAFDALGVGMTDDEAPRVLEGGAPAQRRARAVSAAAPIVSPEWLRAPAPQEARPPRPLSPSAIDEGGADPPPGPELRAAAERGRLLHKLFERLPAVAPEARAGAAARWLERAGGVTDAAVREALVDDALRVIEHPDHAALFGADSLAEAPIAAVVGDGMVIAGTVDRLLVEPERVRVIDFKTMRRAPSGIDAVPVPHIRQMAAYVAALSVIFPERRIEAGLLYTAGPRLLILPDDLLAAHKPGLAAQTQSFAHGG